MPFFRLLAISNVAIPFSYWSNQELTCIVYPSNWAVSFVPQNTIIDCFYLSIGIQLSRRRSGTTLPIGRHEMLACIIEGILDNIYERNVYDAGSLTIRRATKKKYSVQVNSLAFPTLTGYFRNSYSKIPHRQLSLKGLLGANM